LSSKTKKIILIKPLRIDEKSECNSNKHHRHAKANGGASKKGNISKVKVADHRAFHYFFNGNNGIPLHPQKVAEKLQILHPMIEQFFCNSDGTVKTIEQVAQELNKVWIDKDYEIVISK